ncbi:alpha-methylacyl-CoA racemase [Mesorhizobium sp. L-8-10]|uniref:CaiB/BaiF CoA transferase family protein n=1 Tax=Mesorhizobium sp. L-8-10 TaxID=2744523 RepID=UPI0019282D71|nr:CaiB/BaiF CoA-transferase family protein [Mesorhizobium sp. L-8-10]BCH29792.1 alpha-methylacyl-CoA racemase [Mesorhizobium sp. L-8-10]
MAGPLEGLKIVEFVGLGPTSFTAMMLSDMGADVVRIDRRSKAGEPNPYPVLGTKYDVMARNRGTVFLDLKTPEGLQVAFELLEKADALLEGFRPGVMERVGLSPDKCIELNPRLVYTRITGWGQSGPLSHTAGHDINYIALSGLLAATGAPGTPPLPPLNLIGDFGGGGMLAAFGVLCGIMYAQRTGKGQVVDAAMLDGTNLMGAMIFGLRSMGRWSLERGRNWIDGGAPYYGCYECADGKYVGIGPIEPHFFALLAEKAGLDEDIFRDIGVERWPALREEMARVFRTRTRAEWCGLLERSDACVSPVLDLDEAPAHPQNAARGNFVDVDGVLHSAPAPRFSRTPGAIRAKDTGDAASTLETWGLPHERIAALREKGVI